jgi:hypothetical protein
VYAQWRNEHNKGGETDAIDATQKVSTGSTSRDNGTIPGVTFMACKEMRLKFTQPGNFVRHPNNFIAISAR